MAEMVTGSIGSENVELYNAATEITLQELRDAVLSMTKKSNVNTKNVNKQLDELHESSKKLTEEQKLQIKSAREQTAEDRKLIYETRNVIAGIKNFARAVGNVALTIFRLETAIASMGGSISSGLDVFGEIPIAGKFFTGYLGGAAKVIDNAQKAFFQVTQVGATLGGEFGVLVQSAGEAALDLDKYSELVAKSGDLIARLGGGTEAGIVQFRKMTALMKNEVLNGLSNLGISFEEAQEVMASYNRQLIRSGRARGMSEGELVDRTKQYLTHLTAVSRLTGESRKDLEAKAEERRRTAQFESWLSSMDATTQAEVNKLFTLFESFGMADLAQDMLLSGVPLNEVTGLLATMVPGANDLFLDLDKAIKNNDPEAIAEFSDKFLQMLAKGEIQLDQGLKDTMQILAQRGDVGFAEILTAYNRIRALQNNIEGDIKDLSLSDVLEQVKKDAGKTETDAQKLARIQAELYEKSSEEQMKLIGRIDSLITALENLEFARWATIIGSIAAAVIQLGAVILGVKALAGLAAGAGAAGGAAGILGGIAKMALLPLLGKFALVAGAGLVGWKIGSWFNDAWEEHHGQPLGASIYDAFDKISSLWGGDQATKLRKMQEDWYKEEIRLLEQQRDAAKQRGEDISKFNKDIQDLNSSLEALTTEAELSKLDDQIANLEAAIAQDAENMFADQSITEKRKQELRELEKKRNLDLTSPAFDPTANEAARRNLNIINPALDPTANEAARRNILDFRKNSFVPLSEESSQKAVVWPESRLQGFFDFDRRWQEDINELIKERAKQVEESKNLPTSERKDQERINQEQSKMLENLVNNINTNFEKMLSTNMDILNLNRQQLSVQRGLSGNLLESF